MRAECFFVDMVSSKRYTAPRLRFICVGTEAREEINNNRTLMKKGIIMSIMALALMFGNANAALSVTSDLEYAQKVSELLKDKGVKNRIMDEDEGIIACIYGTDQGDVNVYIDCDARKEAITFFAYTELKIPQSRIASKAVIVNRLNSETLLTKAYIDTDDGQVKVQAWSATDCIPSAATLYGMLRCVVEAAVKTVQELKD